MVKVIYNGLEKCDFVYYLTCILSLTFGKVLVNDLSISQELIETVSKREDADEYTFRNVLFVSKIDTKRSDLSEFDLVIDYRGMYIDYPADVEEDCTHLYMPDYTKKGISIIREAVAEGKPLYILRSFAGKKVTDKSVALVSGLNKEDIVGHIPLNVKDEAAYIALTHNGHQTFKGTSDEMLSALFYAVKQITCLSDKQVNKLMRKAAGLKIK